MYDDIRSNGLNVILIQIDEAHSSAWPMGLKDQPEPQKDFDSRMDRARLFMDTYKCPYEVYVDGWDNVFEKTFRAWPDKFHCVKHSIDNGANDGANDGAIEYIVVSKSEYHRTTDEKEAVIIQDYTDVLQKLMNAL